MFRHGHGPHDNLRPTADVSERGSRLGRSMRSHTTKTTLAAIAAAAALTLSGCGGTPEPDPTPSASETEAPKEVQLPDTVLGAHAKWIVDSINSEDAIVDATIDEHVAPGSVEALGGYDGVRAAFDQLRAIAPVYVSEFTEQGPAAGAVLESSMGRFQLSLAVSADELMESFLVGAYEERPEPAADWEEVDERVNALTSPAHVAVYDITSGTPELEHEFGTLEGTLPSGSMFKLVVLAAVVDQVEAGEISWDDTLTITDEVKSLPSGIFQDQAAGTTHTVRETALEMIRISDNTATDMLIGAVGQDALVDVMTRLDLEGAEQNTPFPTTRAFFQLGWGDNADLRERWSTADTAEREEILMQVAEAPLNVDATNVTTPVWQDGIDWFFSSEDLAKLHVELNEAAATDAGAPVADILSDNPGGDYGTDWENIHFKGGSSVATMGGAWMFDSGDTQWVVTVQFAADSLQSAVSPAQMTFITADIADLLK